MNTALLLTTQLDPTLRPRLERAAELARLVIHTWEPRASGQSRPDVILAGLMHGCRTLPDDLVRLADETYPGTPILLVSPESLVQPVVMLQGGRLCLLGPPHAVEAIVTQLGVALSWREREAETRRSAPADAPEAVAERVVRRSDHLQGNRWAAVIAPVEEVGNAHVAWDRDHGFTALVAPTPPGPQHALPGDLLAALEAWGDHSDTDQLTRALAGHAGTWAVMAHLDEGGQRWLLVDDGRRWPLLMCSPHRLPTCWRFLADDADHHLHVVEAEAEDVVLIAAPLPDDAAFSIATLAAVAAAGGQALAAHLVAQARRLETAITAVVLERRA